MAAAQLMQDILRAKAWPLKGGCVHQGTAQGRDGNMAGTGTEVGWKHGGDGHRAGKGAWRGREQGQDGSMVGTSRLRSHEGSCNILSMYFLCVYV